MALRGVYFGDIHTGVDWGLTMNKYELAPPSIRTTYIEIEGRDGAIDLSEALCGEVKYTNRELKLKFILTDGTFAERNELLTVITNTLHGKFVDIFKDEDHKGYYLEGRFAVENAMNYLGYGEIEITGNMQPFWTKEEETVVEVAAGTSIVEGLFNEGNKTVYPTVVCTATTTIESGNQSYSLAKGTYKLTDLLIKPNTLVAVTVTSVGTTTFKYREGRL